MAAETGTRTRSATRVGTWVAEGFPASAHPDVVGDLDAGYAARSTQDARWLSLYHSTCPPRHPGYRIVIARHAAYLASAERGALAGRRSRRHECPARRRSVREYGRRAEATPAEVHRLGGACAQHPLGEEHPQSRRARLWRPPPWRLRIARPEVRVTRWTWPPRLLYGPEVCTRAGVLVVAGPFTAHDKIGGNAGRRLRPVLMSL